MNKNITTNKAGGLAFKFEDPAEYLLATIGSAMFMEPKYYKDTELNGEFSYAGLDEQATKILNACFEIAHSKNPRDLLALAHWARKELNMRTTPQVMIAIGAKTNATKKFVRKYVPLIATRADDVKQIVAVYKYLFGRSAFPACLKKGVSDRLSVLSEYEILKYNTKDHPSFADLLRFCDRRKDYPFSKEIREYILRGEIIDSTKTPIIAARKQLTSTRRWSDDIPALARRASATWEVLVSQFGSTKEVWEAVIPLMGYMALLRNLGNFLSKGVSLDIIKNIANKISDPERVVNSKQLPFRFLSAYRILDPGIKSNWLCANKDKRDRSNWDKISVNILLEAVEKALDESVNNIPSLSGVSLVAADNSGSMQNFISEKSSITVRDVANILCATVHKRCNNSLVCSFGLNPVWPQLTRQNSVITNAEKIALFEEKYRGHATEGWKVIDHLIKNNIKVDRIIMLSDMQLYNSGYYKWDSAMGWDKTKNTVDYKLEEYRKKINNKCYAHFFDLQGYGTRLNSPDELTNIVGGYSEKIFNQILLFENNISNEERILPSLEYIRENF